jgi:cytochrome c556
VRNLRVILLMVAGLVAGGCSRADRGNATPTRDFGEIMLEVGQRFELMGRAASAGRFELAAFEAGELGELFDNDLPRARLPKEGPTDEIPRMAGAFAKTMPGRLKQAAVSHDMAAFRAAFKDASADCNACHRASAHAFVHVPDEPGRSVPVLDPVSADAGEP